MFLTITSVFAVLCEFLGDFWTFWESGYFFSKNRLTEENMKYSDLMDLES